MKIIPQRAKKVFLAAALCFAYYIFVMLTGIGIPCPVRTVTGGRILCPGCGISRMCINILHFRFADAFGCNPVIFTFLPLWAVCIGMWLFGKGGRAIRIIEYISLAALVVFGIVRNIT